MYCPSCGNELDANNVCINPGCSSNSAITSEFEKETSESNDSTTENIENNENASYNQESNNNQNAGYNQNSNNNQGAGYNQDPNNNQNAGYNQNSNYNENPRYNQNTTYGQNSGYNQGNSYSDKNGISPNEMMDFFGPKNTEYYMDKWNRSQDNPNFISWNWPAFLFGWVWLCFRKMYAIAGIVFAVSTVGRLILPDGTQAILTLVIMIAFGLFANQVYVKNSIDKIRNIKLTTGLNPEILSRRLRDTGGITWVPVIIISVISVLIIIFLIIALIAFGSVFSDYGNFSY